MNRVVRRGGLLGEDPVTGENSYRCNMMIRKELQRWAGPGSFFLLGLVIRSGRFRLIPRSRVEKTEISPIF